MSAALVDFVFSLPGDTPYASSVAELTACMQRFPLVLVHVSFATASVSFAEYQRFLTHVFTTLAERRPECIVIIVDPSIGLVRVATEEPWRTEVAAVSPSVAAALLHHRPAALPVLGDCESHAVAPHDTAHVLERVAHVVNGGTFDRLHNGHRVLLAASACVASHTLTVGITSDAMIAASGKAFKELVQPYAERRHHVALFMQLTAPHVQCRLPAIDDAFGPSIVDAALQTIVVSEETFKGGAAVNEKRVAAGLSVLTVLSIDCWDRHDPHAHGSIESKISSTNARKRLASKV